MTHLCYPRGRIEERRRPPPVQLQWLRHRRPREAVRSADQEPIRAWFGLAVVLIGGLHIPAIDVYAQSIDGSLNFVEVEKDGVGGVDGLDGARSITVSPDGAHVYAAGARDNAIVAFARNETTGELTFVEVEKDGVGGVDGLDIARLVTVSPDGLNVYAVGDRDDGAIVVFGRNATTGRLDFRARVSLVDGLDLPEDVTVSPDGAHVYAADFDKPQSAIAVFARNETTGELGFVEVKKDGVGAVDGLDGARSVTVSPDGAHVYAAGSRADALVAFARNETTGELTFVEVEKDGVGGVDGLDAPSSVTVSPDGAHVYVAGNRADALVAFARNETTGELTFVEVEKDGVGGVDGLDGASSITVSPDGLNVYVASGEADTIAVFTRNETTGELTFVEVEKDGVRGVDGLDGAGSVTVSPDGAHVYSASSFDDAVAVFERNGLGDVVPLISIIPLLLD